MTDVHGDVEMDGLTFNYRRAMGVDRTTAVILEEGSDVLELDVEDDDGDSLSWVVAEGTGHAVFTYLAPKKKLTRAQRRTAAKRAAKSRRKAPAAPRKVIEVKADYAIDLASEAVAIKRRREGFLDAKDVSNLVQLDTLADAALEEHQITEAVGLQLDEARYQVDVHYGLADWVRAIAPSRDFDEDVRIVAMTFGEGDDEKVRVVIEVNTVRQDHDLRAKARARDTRHSLGVQNRQPQGNLTFAAIVDTVYFDSTTDSVTGLWIPDRVRRTIECRLAIDFDQYPMPVSAAASSGTLTSDSGGGSTSGASSASSSSDDGIHQHLMFQFVDSTPPALTKREFTVGGDAFMIAAIETDDASSMLTGAATAHSHPIPHTHTTPAHQHTVPGHTHSLTAAATKEAYPASHSVTLKVYELDAGAWVLRGTIGGLTDDDEEVDLLPYIIGPGRWRIVLKSDVAQPNGGRIGAHLSGYLLGAIQAE